MMPTFPRSPLSFRTASFPQYGWKAGFPSGAFLGDRRLKPGGQYLTGRKLVLPEGVSGRVLRFHPRCPWKNDADELIHVPALIGLFRDVHSDEPKAIMFSRSTK
jgi:hypothetical protein